MKNLFNFKHFKGDLFGGLTAGIVALPLALAFGVSSGLGPSAGLYGAIFVSFFAALFGGTNTQISGPTAPMTAVSMVVIAGIIAINDGDISKALPGILIIFLLSGLIQIGLGFLKLGTYIKYIPNPVVSGFMTAIGVIILITQILPAIGYYPKEDKGFVEELSPQANEVVLEKILKEEKGKSFLIVDHFKSTVERGENISKEQLSQEAKTLAGKNSGDVLGTIKVLPKAIQNINWLELCLALSTIIIIYGFKKITTAVPSTLVALISVSAVAYFAGLNYVPIQEIPSGLPKINFSVFTEFSLASVLPYFFTALTLALLGAIDSLLTSVVADNMTKTKHNPNKELVGQGIGNSIAALFGGIPGAGATIRTVVNIKAGGKTRLSGMMAGVFLLVILLALGPIASQIPAAVLAGILITVGIGVMDYKGLKVIPKMPKDISLKIGKFVLLKLSSEVLIMFTVLVLSSIWNLVYAVGIGLVFAALMFMKKISDLTSKKSSISMLGENPLLVEKIDLPNNLKEEVVVKTISGPLFFGSTSGFQAMASQISDESTAVIIKMEEVSYMDQSGLFALEDVLMSLTKTKTVLLVAIPKQPRYMMEKIDIIPDLVDEEQIFENEKDCLEWIKENIKDTIK